MTERMLHAAGITTGMQVLDVGCGVGDVSFLVSEVVGAHGSVVGVDIDRAALDVADERRTSQRVANIEFRAGGVGSIVVGAGVIGLALVLARHDRAPLSTLAVATVGVLAVLKAMRFINSVVEPPRGQKWIGDIGVIVGVAGCVVLVLTWIGIAAGVH